MKAIITFIFVLAVSAGTYAQDKKVSAQDKFKADLKSNNLSLYILGGFASKATSADEGFQKKFMVKYHDFGCVVPEDADFYKEYNKLVFTHLKKRFGKKWEKDIRKDVMALDELRSKPYVRFMPIPATTGRN